MDGSYSDESNQLNYFYPDESEQHKKYVQKPTAELSDSEDRCEKNFTVSQFKVPNTIQETRHKSIIKVNSKSRTRYLNTYKGSKQETHDLSTNVCTIVKSLFQEFLTFQSPTTSQVKLVHQFMEGKSNLSALRKLFGCNKLQDEQSFTLENEQKQRERKTSSFGEFFFNKMEDTQILKEVLRSKKMKFANKLILFKYLETIKKSGYQPEGLKRWKNKFL